MRSYRNTLSLVLETDATEVSRNYQLWGGKCVVAWRMTHPPVAFQVAGYTGKANKDLRDSFQLFRLFHLCFAIRLNFVGRLSGLGFEELLLL